MINKKNVLNYSEILIFHGSFDETNDRANILLLLPKTRGPFGVTKFKKLIEKKFNLLEYNDVQSEKLNIFNQSKTITFKDKALAVKNALTKWGNVNFHIVCHSTGCGLGTFLAKNNEKNCKSLILISPWNKKDDDFKLLQKRRIENARTLDSISFLKVNINYFIQPITEKFKKFCNYISMQKNKKLIIHQLKKTKDYWVVIWQRII